MSSSELSGASLPEGIEVDEAAAYFGIVESSASLHTLLEMEPTEALCLFLEMTADLHLSEGDFDFETASQRMNCEGGEIYYLVAGHLGMMRLADPLFRYLGMEDSEGESGGPDPGLDDEDSATLLEFTDSMTLLKFLSVGFQHGGADTAKKYLGGLTARISDPGANLQEFKLLSSSLSAVIHSFQNGGEVAPIPGLAEAPAITIAKALENQGSKSTTQQSVPVQQPPVQSTTAATPSAPSPAVSQPSVQKVATSEIAKPVPLPGSVSPPAPLKVLKPMASQPSVSEVPVPLPSQSMPVVTPDRKDSEKEKDAFAGAFGLPTPAVNPLLQSTSPNLPIEDTIAIPEPVSAELETPSQYPSTIVDEIEPESFADVSMENMLQSISTSGHTIPAKEPMESASPVVEQAPVQNLVESQPEVSAKVIESTIEEVPQPAVAEEEQSQLTETANIADVSDDGLPRPVRAAPIRGPVSAGGIQQGQDILAAQQAAAKQQAIAAQQAVQHQALAAQQAAQQQAIAAQQAAQQQAVAQQAAQQQAAAQQQVIAAQQAAQQAAQAYQPTIRSGVHCQGCGIGLDPTWSHCPVCGMGRA